MNLDLKTVRKTINKAFLKEPVERTDFNRFKDSLGQLLDQIDTAQSKNEHEEHFKNFLVPFFNRVGFDDYKINTSGRIDLAIYTGTKAKDPVGVLMEVKRPGNSAEMITKDQLNRKAMHEAVLYYLEQRIEQDNSDLKHVVVTNMDDWFIFDAQEFERCFYKPSALRKTWKEWKADRKVSSNNDFMYREIARFMDEQETTITGLWLPLCATRKFLKGKEDSDYEKKLIPIYKLFSPTHLLKEPFANDSNSLNREFYRELLYILGLEETKKGSTRYIQRADQQSRHAGSIIENTIRILDAEDHLSTLKKESKNYGSDRDEQLFSVAMELSITWMNRILFLKLLEAQLYRYHRQDRKFKFLNYSVIDGLDELNKLFFQVLARKEQDRSADVNEKFGHIPFLNSSLFDVSPLEHQTTRISGLDDHAEMPVYSKSVLTNEKGNTLNTLDYLFRFLEAYDFSAEGSEEIRDERKSLINASVLGLIFEKINGYKDGSFYTPGFITEYMAKETLQKAVIDTFNEKYGWNCTSFNVLYNELHREKLPFEEANAVINDLKICDPAVGSGHFLVSCLNELIAIKSRLDVLCDTDGKVLRQIEVTVENDELIISWGDEGLFEYDVSHAWKGMKLASRQISPELERVQQALFHEKRYLIENCLFGVDINPNSVKICRLRLWIELLKRAYYTPESNYLELEVLPNIDINIKQGNSLVSRFELDSDLSTVFKNSDYSLEDYKEAVRNYKHTGDRAEKQRLQKLIDEIKQEYTTTLTNIRPINKKLSKERGKLELMLSDDLFGKVKFTKKDIKKQKQKVKKLEEQKAEEESGAFYNQAFEWRFEFPEVLDDEGRFTGFDVMIGNPPYGIKFSNKEKDYLKENFESIVGKYDSYGFFIEKGIKLIKNRGLLGYIVPHTWLTVLEAKTLRNYLIDQTKLIEFIKLPSKVFEEAVVETVNVILQKEKNSIVKKNHLIKALLFQENQEVDKIDETEATVHIYKQSFWQNHLIFNIYLSESEQKLLDKIRKNSIELSELCDFSVGVQAYDKYTGQDPETIKERKFHSDKKEDDTYVKELNGRDVKRYSYNWPSKSWISYGKWLAHPRQKKYFDQPRILVREITNSGEYKINACYTEEYLINYKSILNIIIENNSNSYEYNIFFFLGLINSKLMSWYFPRASNKLVTSTFPRISIYDLKQFPIPSSTLISKDKIKIHDQISEYSKKITELKQDEPVIDTSAIESEIDRLVYDLYGLSKEEIRVVEGSISDK